MLCPRPVRARPKRRGPPSWAALFRSATRCSSASTKRWSVVRDLYGQDVDCAGGAQAYYVGLAGFGVGDQAVFGAIVLGQVPYHFADVCYAGCAQWMPLG